VLLSESKRRGVLRVALGLAFTGLLLLAAIGIGRTLYLDAINQAVLPRQAAEDIFDSLIVALRSRSASASSSSLVLGRARAARRPPLRVAVETGVPRAKAAARRIAAARRRPGWTTIAPRCSGASCCSAGSCSSPGTTRPRASSCSTPPSSASRCVLVGALARSGRRARELRRPPRVGDRLEQAIEHHADVAGEVARGEQELEARERKGQSWRRTAFWLAVSAVSLYLVAPRVIEAFGSWRQIERVSPPGWRDGGARGGGAGRASGSSSGRRCTRPAGSR
jgi:hypothetical protein